NSPGTYLNDTGGYVTQATQESPMAEDLAKDLLIGANNIAEFMLGNRSAKARRKVYYMHEQRLIPTFKLGAEIAARPSRLREHISDLDRQHTLAITSK